MAEVRSSSKATMAADDTDDSGQPGASAGPAGAPGAGETTPPDSAPASTPGGRPHRLGRGLLLVLAINLLSASVLVQRHFPGRPTIFVTAAAVAIILGASLALTWKRWDRPGPWIALLVALVASRQALNFSLGTVLGVRDAPYHILGITWEIVFRGHIPQGLTYSDFPFHHLLLAALRLEGGTDLWVTASFLATWLSLVTAVLVVLVTRSILPGAEYMAGILFIAMPAGIEFGQLYQPMSLAVVYFAAMTYLMVRNGDFPLGRALFLLCSVALTFTHPYSATVLGMALLSGAVGNYLFNRRTSYLGVAFLGALFTFVYAGFIVGQFDYFVSLFDWVRGSAVAEERLGEPPRPPSTTGYTVVQYALRILVTGAAAIGWLLVLWQRRGRLTQFQIMAGALAGLFVAGYLFTFLLPERTFALSSVIMAPFAGWFYHRLPRWSAYPLVAILVALALTSSAAAHQYFPWSEGNAAIHEIEDDAAAGSAIAFLSGYAGSPNRAELVTSQLLVYGNHSYQGRPFTSDTNASTAARDFLLFDADAAQYGYSSSPRLLPAAQRDTYSHFPTPGHLALLESSNRLAHYGPYAIYRVP